MTFTVAVARRAHPRVKALRGKAKDKFWQGDQPPRTRRLRRRPLPHARPRGGDAHICGLRFYADWRMHIVFAEDNEIVISWVGAHTDQENPHIDGATDIPQLADIGRPRKDQPPCCDEPDNAPINQKLVDRINTLRPPRHPTSPS